jgi:hypothetical protein
MHAMLNWLWQGCAVALALFAMLGLLERARASVRPYRLLDRPGPRPVAAARGDARIRRAGQPGRFPRVPVDAVVSVPDAWWTSGFVIAAAWFVWAGVGADPLPAGDFRAASGARLQPPLPAAGGVAADALAPDP